MISLYNFLYVYYIRRHWVWFSYDFPYIVSLKCLIWLVFLYVLQFEWNLKFLILPFSLIVFKFFHFPVDSNWSKMLSNRDFSCNEQKFEDLSWLKLNKNALKSRFLLWCANLKTIFLGDEGGGQALGNLRNQKSEKSWKSLKLQKMKKSKNEKSAIFSIFDKNETDWFLLPVYRVSRFD